MTRCQSLTNKGHQCKQEARVYYRHTDGKEYKVCNQHAREGFRPYREVQQA